MNLLFNHAMTLPNGAQAVHHRVVRVELASTMEQLHVSITSWPSEATRLQGHEPIWMAMVVVDVEGLQLQDGLLAGVLAAVLARPEYEGGTPVPDAAETVEAAKARRRAEVKARRDLMEFAPVAVGPWVFDGDVASQRRIAGATVAAMMARQAWLVAAVQALAGAQSVTLPAEPDIEETWTLADNTPVDMIESDILGLAGAVITQVSLAHATCRTVFAELDAAQTLEAVAAVDLPEVPA